MIRRALLAAAIVALALDAACAQRPLAIWVDPDGYTLFWNTTDHPISFDRYQITSAEDRINPAGWSSISDQALPHPLSIATVLGDQSYGFVEGPASTSGLGEQTNTGVATLDPGRFFSIAYVFRDWQTRDTTARFTYGLDGEEWIGDIYPVPEPSTLLLATLAGLGLLGKPAQSRPRNGNGDRL